MNSIARVGSRLGLHSDRAYALVKYGIDLALWSMLVPLAYLLRVEDRFALWLQSMWVYTLAGMVVKAVLIRVFLLHRQSWHKIGVLDLYRLLYAIGAATVILEALALIIRPWLVVPRSVPLIEGVLAVLVLAGARLGVRLFNERLGRQASDTPAQRVLIAGAGEAGTLLAREMLRHPHAGLAPVGYLDDDPQKRRGRFFGLPVLGRIDELPRVVKHLQVDEVLIAMPSESGEVIRRVVELARRAEVRHRTIPGMYEILSGKVSISAIRKVDVEDLLRREPVHLDMKEIAAYLQGRTVLVTGAAGSSARSSCARSRRSSPRRSSSSTARRTTCTSSSGSCRRPSPGCPFTASSPTSASAPSWSRSSPRTGPRSCSTRRPTSTCR